MKDNVSSLKIQKNISVITDEQIIYNIHCLIMLSCSLYYWLIMMMLVNVHSRALVILICFDTFLHGANEH